MLVNRKNKNTHRLPKLRQRTWFKALSKKTGTPRYMRKMRIHNA